MRCQDFDRIARDHARGQWLSAVLREEADRHLETCETCRLRLQAHRALNEQMSALGAEGASQQAPPYLMPRVLSAFRRRSKPAAYSGRLLWAGLAAAACVAAVALTLYKPQVPGDRVQAKAPTELVTEFMPLRYGKPVEAGETLQMIRIKLPQSEMIRLGLPVAPEPARTVKADVLLGEDGLAKAIRIVY